MRKHDTQRRVAVVAGVRTPFGARGGGFRKLGVLELGRFVVSELIERSGVRATDVDRLVFGSTEPSSASTNLARRMALAAALPPSIDAYGVSRGCATSYQAIVSVAEAILSGTIDVGIAAAADSASSALPETADPTLVDRLRALRGSAPARPVVEGLVQDATSAEGAEKLAKLFGIRRSAQDELAHRSHALASKAWEDGRFERDVMHVYVPPEYEVVDEDEQIDKLAVLDDYAALPPSVDRKHGSVTVANVAAPSDGAAALLIMNEACARARGLPVLGVLKSFAFAAADAEKVPLLGPVYATPIALDRARLKLKDLDLFDMHESSAAMVLANVLAFESELFAEERLGRSKRIGPVDWERFNVMGGSIALGHPVAATGARQVLQSFNELCRRNGELALCTTCASDGVGAALILEAA